MRWYEISMRLIIDKTWETQCTISELCSKRFYRFIMSKTKEAPWHLTKKVGQTESDF